MSDDEPVTDGFKNELYDGLLTVDLTPVGNGEVRLTVLFTGEEGEDLAEKGRYSREVFTRPTPRGEFLNNVEDTFTDEYPTVNAERAREELKEWCDKLAELGAEEQCEMLPDELQRIIENTHSVGIYDGEPTTAEVTLTLGGRTRQLSFTSKEMKTDSGGVLEHKLYDQFFQDITVEKEDWEIIRERWNDMAEVVFVNDETTEDAIANRVTDLMAEGLIAVGERDQVTNDTAACWFDEGNTAGYDEVGAEENIVWVQDRYLVDQLETAGKSVEYKGQLVKDLISRGDLLASSARRRWDDGDERSSFYPFEPETLGISESTVTFDPDGDNAAEVET